MQLKNPHKTTTDLLQSPFFPNWRRNVRVKHRPRTQHRNADGLSKRTNEYRWQERRIAQLPPSGERWNFLSTEEFVQLPTAPWFDVQGRVIPNHPDLPDHLQNLEPETPNLVRRVLRSNGQTSGPNRQRRWPHLYHPYRHPNHKYTRVSIQITQKTG